MLSVEAYTDGSCTAKCGGYAAIMTAKGKTRKVCGFCKSGATNNRMELQAVIAVVDWLNRVQKEPCNVTVYTDSSYIVDTSKKTVGELIDEGRKNNDLWLELITKKKTGKHVIKFVKVPAHSGVELNEEADKLAKEQKKIALG